MIRNKFKIYTFSNYVQLFRHNFRIKEILAYLYGQWGKPRRLPRVAQFGLYLLLHAVLYSFRSSFEIHDGKFYTNKIHWIKRCATISPIVTEYPSSLADLCLITIPSSRPRLGALYITGCCAVLNPPHAS